MEKKIQTKEIKQISLGRFLIKQLEDEFGVGYHMVHTAMKFFNNSPKAKALRKRAKELLLLEAAKIDD